MAVRLQDFSDVPDYLAKFRREIDRLADAQNNGSSEDVRDFGINAAITAWHLPEVLRNKNPNLDVNTYRNTLVAKNPDYGLMHDVATQVKHFKISSPMNPATFEVRTSARAPLTIEEEQQLNEHIQKSPDESIYMRLTNRMQIILKIDEGEAVQIFEGIYQFLKTELIPSTK